jgi:hypothetical protein
MAPRGRARQASETFRTSTSDSPTLPPIRPPVELEVQFGHGKTTGGHIRIAVRYERLAELDDGKG